MKQRLPEPVEAPQPSPEEEELSGRNAVRLAVQEAVHEATTSERLWALCGLLQLHADTVRAHAAQLDDVRRVAAAAEREQT